MHVWQSLKFAARSLALRSHAHASPAVVQRKQRSRLERLLRHARANSSYLRDKYASVDPRNFSLSDLPTSSKAEIMEHFEDWLTVDDVRRPEVEAFIADHSNVGKLFRDRYVLSHTSGSEGQPLLLVKSPDEFELMFALQAARGTCNSLTARQVLERLREPARLAAVTVQPGFFPSSTAFDYAPAGARQYIDVLRLSITDEQVVERLQEFRPTHLTAYASVLHELVRHVEAGKLQFRPDLEQVVNIAEKLLPEARKYYTEVFGAPVLDDYGMGECLFLTNGCPTSGGMHVNADWAVLEVVDDRNQPVPAGERGAKVLLTNLANYVQPFIRYEVGDIAVMATEPCGCGSKLPLISHLEGRRSSILRIGTAEDARPLHPTVINQAVHRFSGIREFQVVQEEPYRIRVRVEPLPNSHIDRGEIEASIKSRLVAHGFDESLQIEVEIVERLTADPAEGKFKRVLIPAALQYAASDDPAPQP